MKGLSETMRIAPRRWLFIDLFRGAFALIMIEGHTFRALLDPSIKARTLFRYHEWIHSMPGPAFLFCSGVAFSFATFNHWNAGPQSDSRIVRRLLRLSGLLVVGYLLHLTYFSFHRTWSQITPDGVAALLRMDILQCIAVSGILLQIIVMVSPNQRWFLAVCAVSAVTVAFATPYAWRFSAHLPMWLGTNFCENWGSLFPLFPYLGFQFAGAAWGTLFRLAPSSEHQANLLRRTWRYGLGLSLASLAFALLPVIQAHSDLWNSGPGFFFPRLGILGVLTMAFSLAESAAVTHLRAIVLLGRNSLVVYLAHVLLLYGSALNANANIVKVLGERARVTEAAFVSLLLIVSTASLVWAWNHLKENYKWGMNGIRFSVAVYLLYCFLAS